MDIFMYALLTQALYVEQFPVPFGLQFAFGYEGSEIGPPGICCMLPQVYGR